MIARLLALLLLLVPAAAAGAEPRRDRRHDAPRDDLHGRAGRDQWRLCLGLSARHVAPLGRDRGAAEHDLGPAAGHRDDGPPLPRRLSRHRRRLLLPRRPGRDRGADPRPAPLRRLALFHRFRRPRLDPANGTGRSAAMPGGWRNSSIMPTMRPSTMPAPPRRCSSCCACIWSGATGAIGAPLEPGDRFRPEQPISERRLAAALAAHARLSGLCALHHLQRRCRAGEYPLPARRLSVARRNPGAPAPSCAPARSSSPPSSRCRSPAGASSIRSTSARPARAATSRSRSPPTPPPRTSG